MWILWRTSDADEAQMFSFLFYKEFFQTGKLHGVRDYKC